MSVVIHIDDNLQSDSTDLVLDFVEAMTQQGYELDDLVAAMLCAVSEIVEAQSIDQAEMM